MNRPWASIQQWRRLAFDTEAVSRAVLLSSHQCGSARPRRPVRAGTASRRRGCRGAVRPADDQLITVELDGGELRDEISAIEGVHLIEVPAVESDPAEHAVTGSETFQLRF